MIGEKKNEYYLLCHRFNREFPISSVMSGNNTKSFSNVVNSSGKISKTRIIHSAKENYLIKKYKLADYHLEDKFISKIMIMNKIRYLNVDRFNEFPWANF